jgi:hypothetical protein
MLDSHSRDSEEVARDAVAYVNAVGLLSLRNKTTPKMLWLFASGICQVFAMAAIGGCVWMVTVMK